MVAKTAARPSHPVLVDMRYEQRHYFLHTNTNTNTNTYEIPRQVIGMGGKIQRKIFASDTFIICQFVCFPKHYNVCIHKDTNRKSTILEKKYLQMTHVNKMDHVVIVTINITSSQILFCVSSKHLNIQIKTNTNIANSDKDTPTFHMFTGQIYVYTITIDM